jgi:hypothetical protein
MGREFGAERLQRLTGFHQIGQLDLLAADHNAHRVGHRLRGRALDEGTAGPSGPDPNQVLHLQDP